MENNSLISSFGFAFSGIWQAVKRERNLKIHLLAAILVILAGIYFKISRLEWLVLVLTISLVLTAEIFNSAIEEICNLLKEKLSLDYGKTTLIRNLSAGAVLILAIGSVILGLIIFLPHLLSR
ncbi:MAG: diacylglycerol kinase family protein [Patescibacteria group bacterium]